MKGSRGHSSFILIRKKQHLVTLALVSPRRNERSRAQTSIFTIENNYFLVQMAPQGSWPPGLPAESLEARISQPRMLSQASSAKIPQPGVLSQESSASCLQPICLGSALESCGLFLWQYFVCDMLICVLSGSCSCSKADIVAWHCSWTAPYNSGLCSFSNAANIA